MRKRADMHKRSYPEPRTCPSLWDGLVVLAVVLLALGSALLFWQRGGGEELTAVISIEGETAETVKLSRLSGEEERSLEANGYTLTLRLSPEGAQVLTSDCPTQDCVHTGEITRPGQSIVCLPARVSVQLTGTAADGLDTVIG